MIFDTDVLIWILRGNLKAANFLDQVPSREICVATYMELLHGARDKAEVRAIKTFLAEMQFATLPLTENIGHRAAIYIEEYGLAVAMGPLDALLAAAAVENNLPLVTGNAKHYRHVRELDLVVFRP